MTGHQGHGDVFAAWITPGTVTTWFRIAGHLTYQSGCHPVRRSIPPRPPATICTPG
ncbi:MAG TPA: hypothetical protein VFZ32_21555 [Micromonosporaceae bacterium]